MQVDFTFSGNIDDVRAQMRARLDGLSTDPSASAAVERAAVHAICAHCDETEAQVNAAKNAGAPLDSLRQFSVSGSVSLSITFSAS